MKGISPFITQTIFVGLSAFLIFAVLTVMNSVTVQYKNYASDVELEQLCLTMRSAMETVYVDPTYVTSSNITYGRINVNLPERIASTNYLLKFTGSDIYIASSGYKNYSCSTRFNFRNSGSTTGGLTQLTYKYYNNGTKTFEIIKL